MSKNQLQTGPIHTLAKGGPRAQESTCLRCGEKFKSADVRCNRVCAKCNAENDRAPGIVTTREDFSDGRVIRNKICGI